MPAGTLGLVKMVQHAKISWMVLPIALTVVVYLDTREPFAKRTLMNASLVRAKMEDFALITSIGMHVCANQKLKE